MKDVDVRLFKKKKKLKLEIYRRRYYCSKPREREKKSRRLFETFCNPTDHATQGWQK